MQQNKHYAHVTIQRLRIMEGAANLAGIYERVGMWAACYLGSKQKAFCPSFTNGLRVSDTVGSSLVLP